MSILSPAFPGVKISISSLLRPPDSEMENEHPKRREKESERALPRDDLQRLESVVFQDPLLEHELAGDEDLRQGDQEDPDHGLHHLWRMSRRMNLSRQHHGGCLYITRRGNRLAILKERARKPHDANAQNNTDQCRPLIQPQASAEKNDAEEANKQNRTAPNHLVDASSHQKEADVHQRCTGNITTGWQGEEDQSTAA